MTWDDENYYMVAFDSAAGIIKHYRVDKMEKITVLDEERDGQDAYEALDMAVYARKTFGMFTGERSRFISVSKIIWWAPYSTVSGGM